MSSKTMAVSGLAVVLVIALLVYSNTQPKTPAPVSETSTTISATASSTSTETMMKALKDGSYTVKGMYTSPAGPDEIDVTITLKDGMVTESEVTALAENPKSKFFQGKFVETYKTSVEGKKVSDLKNLVAVGGASLTTKGFIDALSKVEAQAAM
jgi:hypothetical protein